MLNVMGVAGQGFPGIDQFAGKPIDISPNPQVVTDAGDLGQDMAGVDRDIAGPGKRFPPECWLRRI